MAAATRPSTGNRTGAWRFEKPVFTEGLAPCRRVCPVAEDIPAVMALQAAGRFREALELIRLENPFPGICGALCHRPCERACNRGRYDQAVSIRDLELFASQADSDEPAAPRPEPDTGPPAAVAGTDIAGCACAYFLKILGYAVTLVDAAVRPRVLDPAPPGPWPARAGIEREFERLTRSGIRLRLGVPFDDALIAELGPACEVVYLSEAAPEAWARRWEGARGGGGVEIARIESGSRAQPAVAVFRAAAGGRKAWVGRTAAGPEARPDAPGKSAVLGIGRGKLAAAALDTIRRGLPADGLLGSRLPGSGVLSMQAYRRALAGAAARTPALRTVGLADINTAAHPRSRRIEPETAGGLFSPQQAVRSARRCFRCGICTFCNACRDYCPDLAVSLDPERRLRRIDYDYCKGCGICAQECPHGAIAWERE
jgi:2-oxoacid:acceptor oxidoreductase delta subunit (pyruvate/2-ketoisovalerate family)